MLGILDSCFSTVVWDLVVKAHLTNSQVQEVVLFPEDPSLQSVTFAVHQERVGVGQSGALSDDYSC